MDIFLAASSLPAWIITLGLMAGGFGLTIFAWSYLEKRLGSDRLVEMRDIAIGLFLILLVVFGLLGAFSKKSAVTYPSDYDIGPRGQRW